MYMVERSEFKRVWMYIYVLSVIGLG